MVRVGESPPLVEAVEMDTYCDPRVAMVDQAATVNRPAVVKRLLERIEDEAGMRRPAGPPRA